MFGHTIGRAIAFGYVEDGGRVVNQEFLRSGSFEIEVAGERLPARCTLGALYDPKSERIRM
jgi:4-methylaminobutanoate oxidase (formaldehyde-forming)